MKFAALGRTRTLLESIRAVVARGHECVLIGTCPAAPEYSVCEGDFEALAAELGCPFFCDVKINRQEYVDLARASGAEVAISVNWQTLIRQEMLDVFRFGVINAHAGDLPRYRGNAVPNWAILAGESGVVLTLHQMSTDLDAGPIIAKRRIDIRPSTHIGEIYASAEEWYPVMFADAVDACAAGKLVPEPQPTDASLALRCYPRLPRDSEIDWTRPAEEIERLVRAVSEPFGGAYTFLGNERLIVWRARRETPLGPHLVVPGHVAERRPATGEVWVATGRDWLALAEVETASAGRGAAAQIIRSNRVRLGMHVSGEIERLHLRVAELERRLAALSDASAQDGPGAHPTGPAAIP